MDDRTGIVNWDVFSPLPGVVQEQARGAGSLRSSVEAGESGNPTTEASTPNTIGAAHNRSSNLTMTRLNDDGIDDGCQTTSRNGKVDSFVGGHKIEDGPAGVERAEGGSEASDSGTAVKMDSDTYVTVPFSSLEAFSLSVEGIVVKVS